MALLSARFALRRKDDVQALRSFRAAAYRSGQERISGQFSYLPAKIRVVSVVRLADTKTQPTISKPIGFVTIHKGDRMTASGNARRPAGGTAEAIRYLPVDRGRVLRINAQQDERGDLGSFLFEKQYAGRNARRLQGRDRLQNHRIGYRQPKGIKQRAFPGKGNQLLLSTATQPDIELFKCSI